MLSWLQLWERVRRAAVMCILKHFSEDPQASLWRLQLSDQTNKTAALSIEASCQNLLGPALVVALECLGML